MTPHTFTARVAATVARAELPPVSMLEDAADKRVKVRFGFPPAAWVCELLKTNGFRWRGESTGWARKLDSAGVTAARLVLAQLSERTETDNQ